MKPKQINARRIGWIVEGKLGDPAEDWEIISQTWHSSPSSAIDAYGEEEYEDDYADGLARCVPVYTEVKP